ncbi:ABC transporter permease [Solicola gregarius]|uniref:ABC transporter permease n=1 Tax=Solicola gregarius TaxID=2908642 RepID=A0AA46TJ46_9ACTN|nr:ABC transporter permease subunit [Solicola gregarius]UYM06186.1 ABC transporter permease [Solicola gregarius]
MYDVMRAELFKLRKRPAVWTLLAAAIVLNQIFGYVVPYMSYTSGDENGFIGDVPSSAILAGMMPDQINTNTLGAFPVFAGALALVLGAIMFGGEHGFGTVKTLLTQRPGRATTVAGQLGALLVALAIGVAVLYVLGLASSVGVGLAEGVDFAWPSALSLIAGYAAGVLIMMMWAVLGAMLGATMRSVALPIGLGVVWVLGVELLISSMAETLTGLEPIREILPGVNAGSVVSQWLTEGLGEAPPGVESVVPVDQGLVVLALYVVVGAAITLFITKRRDVV